MIAKVPVLGGYDARTVGLLREATLAGTEAIEPPRRPDAVLRHFLGLVSFGHIEEVPALLTDEVVHKVGEVRLQTVFRESWEEIVRRGGMVSVGLINRLEGAGVVDYDVEMHYGDGSTDVERIVMRRDSRGWKVDLAT